MDNEEITLLAGDASEVEAVLDDYESEYTKEEQITSEAEQELEDAIEIQEEATFTYSEDLDGLVEIAEEEIPAEIQTIEAAPEIEAQEVVNETSETYDEKQEETYSSREVETSSNESYYEEILEKLETLPSSSQVDSLIDKLDEVSDHVYTLNQNVVRSSSNNSVYHRFQIGFMIAMFAAILIYFAFSKFS